MAYGWRASIAVYDFPDPSKAGAEGLLAVGGDLSPMRLLSAYSRGIFPWFSEGDPVMWWSPDPRMILMPPEMKISKSTRALIRKGGYEFSFDTEFDKVIGQCSLSPRPGQDGTWITEEMLDAYKKLHALGFAHSAEIKRDGKLVGGLYGISIGDGFFGESMFHLEANASKLAFYHLAEVLRAKGFLFVDCQMSTSHLASLGAREIPREVFLEQLTIALEGDDHVGSWTKWTL